MRSGNRYRYGLKLNCSRDTSCYPPGNTPPCSKSGTDDLRRATKAKSCLYWLIAFCATQDIARDMLGGPLAYRPAGQPVGQGPAEHVRGDFGSKTGPLWLYQGAQRHAWTPMESRLESRSRATAARLRDGSCQAVYCENCLAGRWPAGQPVGNHPGDPILAIPGAKPISCGCI